MKTLISLLALLCAIQFCYAQTAVTSDYNNVLNVTSIVTQTSGGQTFFTGHQLGSSYASPSAIYRAWTDNPVGASNYFYEGIANGITYSVRADGQGYFASGLNIGGTMLGQL